MSDPRESSAGWPGAYRPSSEEIVSLITRAEAHPLGRSFLADGALDAVAATFGVHANVVENARGRITGS